MLQAMFRKLRDSWIRIANDAQFSKSVANSAERLQRGHQVEQQPQGKLKDAD
jgi:hypothetical protein